MGRICSFQILAWLSFPNDFIVLFSHFAFTQLVIGGDAASWQQCECPVCVCAPLGGSIITTTAGRKSILEPALLLRVPFSTEEEWLLPESLKNVIFVSFFFFFEKQHERGEETDGAY